MAKSKLKSTIKNRLVSHCDFHLENNNIISEIKGKSSNDFSIIIAKNKYSFRDGKTSIPNTKKNQQLIKNGKFSVETMLLGRRIRFKIPKANYSISQRTLGFEGKSYPELPDASLEITDLKIQDDLLIIDFETFTFGNDRPVILYLISKDYDILERIDIVDESRAVIHDLHRLSESSDDIRLVMVSETGYYSVSGQDYIFNNVITELNNGEFLIHFNTDEKYSFSASVSKYKIPPLAPKSNYIDSVHYEVAADTLIISMKESVKTIEDGSFSLILTSFKTGEKESVFRTELAEEIVIENLYSIFERKIDYIERFFISFEITDAKGSLIESGNLSVTKPKKFTMSGQTMAEFDNTRIAYFYNSFLVLENKENHFLYDKKFYIDQKNATTSCDLKDLYIEGFKVGFTIKLVSLLEDIKEVTIFARDNYKKRSFHILTKAYEGSHTIEDDLVLDLDVLKEKFYYNMRLNFHIGIKYASGYTESTFLTVSPGQYHVRDRYLVEEHYDDGMMSSVYIGENRFNLNLWYTSEDEFIKGVNTQSGKETYDRVMETEPLDSKLIVFEANLGKDYTGNPKYLYEYMLNDSKYKDFKFVWSYPDDKECNIPGSPITVERGSEEYFSYLGKAKYWVNNILFPVKEKRRGVVYLNTWHGTPLKKLGFDIEVEGPEKQAFDNLYRESLNWDHLLVDNDYGEEKLTGAFHFTKNVIKKGYPINDIFYDEDRLSRVRTRLMAEYPQIGSKKVVLYAPTWRDLQGDYIRGYDFELPFDLGELFESISDEYVIVVKLHHLIADNLVIDEKYKDFIINMSHEEDIMELLSITDILITDYSSVFYDFASMRKPILFYMYDLEEYLNETRGLYVGIDTLPGPILRTTKELVDSIESIRNGSFRYEQKLFGFCDETAKYCKGTSCKDVLDIVISEGER